MIVKLVGFYKVSVDGEVSSMLYVGYDGGYVFDNLKGKLFRRTEAEVLKYNPEVETIPYK